MKYKGWNQPRDGREARRWYMCVCTRHATSDTRSVQSFVFDVWQKIFLIQCWVLSELPYQYTILLMATCLSRNFEFRFNRRFSDCSRSFWVESVGLWTLFLWSSLHKMCCIKHCRKILKWILMSKIIFWYVIENKKLFNKSFGIF